MDPYLKNSDIIDNFDHIEIQIIPNDFLSKNIDNDSNESTIDDNNDNHNCLIVFWQYNKGQNFSNNIKKCIVLLL
ncbi:hypothetical protein DERP_011383 [Dermatophagoides pteronyssinus]|uniref:Uncharacterized protein n=1 Tax=Dermatophagoides pteronyssinus TaxID=6956 RepID=A0ABQ8J548_DERPT|nr:hypothetical protein DERP_011383 [Dermatophagoides pteronyssinus]